MKCLSIFNLLCLIDKLIVILEHKTSKLAEYFSQRKEGEKDGSEEDL
jgi:hypothetical protein